MDKAATQLVLDTRDFSIQKAEGQGADGKWSDLKFELGGKDPILGSKLTIDAADRQAQVRVNYATSPEASGLQWLDAGDDRGQADALHVQPVAADPRALLGAAAGHAEVRFTYSAHVTAPADAMVLMSADNDPAAARDGDYSFKMPQPIPSYLLAIAVGDLVFKPLGARTGV